MLSVLSEHVADLFVHGVQPAPQAHLRGGEVPRDEHLRTGGRTLPAAEAGGANLRGDVFALDHDHLHGEQRGRQGRSNTKQSRTNRRLGPTRSAGSVVVIYLCADAFVSFSLFLRSCSFVRCSGVGRSDGQSFSRLPRSGRERPHGGVSRRAPKKTFRRRSTGQRTTK